MATLEHAQPLAPDATMLGRLLVIQQAIDAMPDEVHIAAFVGRALASLPAWGDRGPRPHRRPYSGAGRLDGRLEGALRARWIAGAGAEFHAPPRHWRALLSDRRAGAAPRLAAAEGG
jgi:hypothetical protein